MHCVRKVNESLTWVGADDRKIHIFEGIYPLKRGMSYNSYLLKDEKTVLLDTVDKACLETFLENVKYVLDGRKLDYIIVHHMEPDHSATLKTLLDYYPDVTVVCNQKILNMIYQFFGSDLKIQTLIVNEGDTLNVGEHTFHFVNAPMVHWPEVMMSYESKDKILFSADAFGTFGALNGHLFNDEVDFFNDYLDEARRYYTNIVGKYGPQVQAVLKKASALDIKLICPLHGFVFRKDLDKIIDKYLKWSSYTPEKKGVLLVAVTIILAVFTACQPTPEIEQVVNKGSSVMDEALKEDNISPQSLNIPEEYFYEYTSSNGNIKVTTDAEIVFTDNDALPVYSAKIAPFTEQQIEKVVNFLIGEGTVLLKYDTELSKEELTEKLLLPAQQQLAEVQSGKEIYEETGILTEQEK